MRRLIALAVAVVAASAILGCSGGDDDNNGTGGTGATGIGGTGGPAGGSGGEGGTLGTGGTGGKGGTGGDGGGAAGSGGTGGSGGVGGGGGSGGTGGVPGPTIDEFEPKKGIIGVSVKIKGTNFGKDKAKLQVKFKTTPALIDGLNKEGTEIVTHVPGGATSGSIVVIRDGVSVDTGRKEFTVLHENPLPILLRLEPEVATAGGPDVPVSIEGVDFTNTSRVLIEGEELGTDYDTPEALRATIPEVKIVTPKSYRIWVENSPPGGGKSKSLVFRVVPAMKVLRAQATGPRSVRVEFDQAVDIEDAANHNLFRASEPQSTMSITRTERDPVNPKWVNLYSSNDMSANADYIVIVDDDTMTSEIGGTLDPTAAQDTFWSYGSTPRADGVYGQNIGCGIADMTGPYGISSYGNLLYVVEREGQQVQVVGLDGKFTGFFGISASVAKYHTKAGTNSTGCPVGGSDDPGGFQNPRGGVALGAAGELIAADPENDRVFLYAANGAYDTNIGSGWQRPIVVGLLDGKAVLVNGDDKIRLFDFDGDEDLTTALSSGSGTGDGQFSFGNLIATRLPGMAVGGGKVYFSEPTNHRVQRLEDGVSTGWIGTGHVNGFAVGGTCCDMGIANSEFTFPRGVAVDAAGQIYVVDEAGSAPGKGRLQKFDPAGKFKVKVDLDYMPAGLTMDQEGYLWIVDTTNTRLRRYKP